MSLSPPLTLGALAAEAAIYDGYALIERASCALSSLRRMAAVMKLIPAAEVPLIGCLDDFDALGLKFRGALAVYERAIECLETV